MTSFQHAQIETIFYAAVTVDETCSFCPRATIAVTLEYHKTGDVKVSKSSTETIYQICCNMMNHSLFRSVVRSFSKLFFLHWL